nr:asparagine synthase (glutamine-hydrolyzing) [uncultured Desulfobacter sp.]
MCGILGTVNKNFDESVLNLIRRRGPDDSGIERFSIDDDVVTLGHRRLSIVDLSPAGHQPMSSMDKRFSIIFNGEIYNHLALRAKLPGAMFRGHSDTETILNYIAEYGIKSVREFNGIFSFAFLDSEKKTLILCRDPFGVKPLYYWQHSNQLVFSSEIRPVQKLAGDTIDLINLSELLSLRYSPSPDTLFKHIHKLRPGHFLTVTFGSDQLNLKEEPFMCQKLCGYPNNSVDAIEQYGELLKKAVERQLMSDVEVGTFLSGGIDSALVAKYAQEKTSHPMKAFTVGFKEQHDSDEVEDAIVSADVIGSQSIITRVGFDDFLDVMQSCVKIVEEPLATTSIIPMYYLAQLASESVKVVLSGQGADESLGGYGRYQGELYHRFIPPFLAASGKNVIDFLGIGHEQLNRGLSALQYREDVSRFLSAYAVFEGPEIEKLIGMKDSKSRQRVQYFYDLNGCASMKSSVERMMAIDLRMNLADDLLLYTDKVTMHFSLECRVPMLDNDLVNFILGLPYDLRVGIGKSKIIHKEWAKKVLPASIINRKKKGFQSPTKKWFRSHSPVWEMLLSKTSRFSNFFDIREVKKVLSDHEKGLNRERQIFLLLSLYYWLEEFG